MTGTHWQEGLGRDEEVIKQASMGNSGRVHTSRSCGSSYQMVCPPCSLVLTSFCVGRSQGRKPFLEQYHTFSRTVDTRLIARPSFSARPAHCDSAPQTQLGQQDHCCTDTIYSSLLSDGLLLSRNWNPRRPKHLQGWTQQG